MALLGLLEEPALLVRPAWRPPTDAKVVSPFTVPAPLFLATLLCFWLGARGFASFLVVPVMIALTAYSILNLTASTFPTALMLGTLPICYTGRAMACFWSSDIETWRRNGESAAPAPRTLVRLSWSWDLLMQMRGVGWSWEARTTPPKPLDRRGVFLIKQAIRILVELLALDFFCFLLSYSPYWLTQEATIRSNGETIGLIVIVSLAHYVGLDVGYSAGAFACVASRWSSPEDWPDLFGPWSATRSVGSFWGEGWHQILRRAIVCNARPLRRLLPFFPPAAVVVVAAFAQSALVHMVMNYTVGREWHGAAFTFLIQPIGIGLERLFSPLLRQRLGLPSWIGYFWTLAWILTTCAPFEFEAIRAGYWSSDRASTTVFGRSEAFMASL